MTFSKGADNPKDPMRGTIDTPTTELLRKLADAAHGFSFEAVIAAASSMLVTGVRQCYASRSEAERRFDEISGQNKDTLLKCYDSTTGKRLNIFPHTQTVEAVHHNDTDTIRG